MYFFNSLDLVTQLVSCEQNTNMVEYKNIAKSFQFNFLKHGRQDLHIFLQQKLRHCLTTKYCRIISSVATYYTNRQILLM
jgi:hypothetical protein